MAINKHFCSFHRWADSLGQSIGEFSAKITALDDIRSVVDVVVVVFVVLLLLTLLLLSLFYH